MFVSSSRAGALLEVGGTYLSDSTNSSSTTTSTKYLYQVGVLFNIRKKIWGGWNYSGISHTDKNDETETFTSMDTGPYFKWEFGKNEVFNLGFAYNILSRATFKNGSVNEKWEGTSFWFQFGVMPEIKEGLHIGASLNYFAASYTKKTVESVESTDSNSKTWIFPMLSLTKQW
ncbi:hypothetical protein [Bdellovibrio sp. HCB2-146]|uniref:hypothetical protein n=1 Tax=Bdellovibrio sp. HCB2-146 TaxID=3394362 RepID=UPI0039BC840C